MSMGDPWHSYVGSTSVLPDKMLSMYAGLIDDICL